MNRNVKFLNNKLCPGIKLLVCDMAGTTVNEKGIVYNTLYSSLKKVNERMTRSDIDNWYGINKNAVISHFVREQYSGCEALEMTLKVNKDFNNSLEEQYFYSDSIELIDPELPNYLTSLRENGVKIGLNTGYSTRIQKAMIDNLGMNDYIDDYISSEEVHYGRPYPYMIYHLMERLNINNINEVAKIGDTVNDIKEGVNAGCYQTIGVLSGAETRESLELEAPNNIVDIITDLKLD